MSSLVVTTAPASEPVSLAEARAHLRLTGDDDEQSVTNYLMAARQFVENYIGRALINRTYDFKLDWGWPCRDLIKRIVLPMPPLVSVTSINYIDTTGTSQLLASNQYQVTLGNVYGSIVEAYAVTWPSVRNQVDAITVRFVAGYGTTAPDAVRQAILLMTGHMYENREAAAIRGANVSELPFGIGALLSNYRVDLL